MGAEKYIYLWVIVIILMRGWDSPDSLFESEPLPRTILGGFWASFLDEAGSSLRKQEVVHISIEGCSKMWAGRKRRGHRGRKPKPIHIERKFTPYTFKPSPPQQRPPILLSPVELEILRLVDIEGLPLTIAGQRIGVSRTTVWRILKESRRKIASAILTGRPIAIAPASEQESP